SAKKLRDARDKGDVPRSRELTTAASLLAVAAALSFSGGAAVSALMGLLRTSVGHAARPSMSLVEPALTAPMAPAARVLAPVLAVSVLVSGLAVYLQIGPVFAPGRVAPQLQRLDPLPQLRRMFGADGIV